MKQKKRRVLLAAVWAAALLLALPGMPQKAKAETSWPVLREDVEENAYKVRYVLGSEISRKEIAGVQFEGSLASAPGDAWDVSQARDGRVLAWVTDAKDDRYALHIAGDGGVRLPENCAYLFAGYDRTEKIDFNNCVSTAGVTDMSHMFDGIGWQLTSLDLSCFDTGSVTDMSHMFEYCTGLTALDLSGFDTKNVTNMNSMFSNCRDLITLDVSGFDTKNVTDMGSMFWGCENLMHLDVSGFYTGKVTDMSFMFGECGGLTTLDVSGFETGNVTDMKSMFWSCWGLTALDVTGFDTGNVTDMNSMFSRCEGLTELDITSFNTENLVDFSSMFDSCTSLMHIWASAQFYIPEYLTWEYKAMFENCPAGGLTIR